MSSLFGFLNLAKLLSLLRQMVSLLLKEKEKAFSR